MGAPDSQSSIPLINQQPTPTPGSMGLGAPLSDPQLSQVSLQLWKVTQNLCIVFRCYHYSKQHWEAKPRRLGEGREREY